jgi:hypothetical protein
LPLLSGSVLWFFGLVCLRCMNDSILNCLPRACGTGVDAAMMRIVVIWVGWS